MPVSSNFRNTYQSQFVPLPLEQFAKTNELNQAKQDAQVAQLEQTDDALWKVRGVADADNEYIAGLKGAFETAASDLVNKDLTQRENQDAVKGLVKGVSRDKNLGTIMLNTAKYQEYLKNREDMTKAGTYHQANDAGELSLAEYNKNGGYKSGRTIDSTIYKYEDGRPVKEQYFNNLASLGQDQVGKVGETFYKYGYEGISEGRVGKQAAAAIKDYMGTTAAQQDGRMYDLAVRQGSINPKKQSKESYIFEGFLNAGMERAGMSFKSGLAEAKNAEAKKKEDAANLGTFLTQGANPVLTGGYTFDYDDNGNIKGGGQKWADVWKNSTGVFDFIQKAWSDESFNMEDSKDKTGYMLQAAAKLNGMKPKDYVEMKAGPDVKLTTTFTTLPTKKLDAYNKQLYDMSRDTGVFATIPMMNIKTGEKGSASEILRLMAERGELKNKKGETISMSDNPTAGEVKQVLDEIGMGVVGEQAPNYFSPKSMVVGIGTQQVAIDRTYGGQLTEKLIKSGELSLQQVRDSRAEAIKAAPIIENDSKTGEPYIHYYDEKERKIGRKKLSELKD